MDQFYENLANAIILQAIADYRAALRLLRRNPAYSEARRVKAEVERFFRSPWYAVLTDLDGELLMAKLQKEAA